ncbi:hypothetical protein GCM10011369_36600 [Neiella marina]|uniref:Serine protease n=1 Tax=Neiella marina TaxID=508461 RepID=A0A8J2UB69_9GAMM|nr:S8 family serine peptidase [Neiella marina]GGA91173.1 hypothetical protein GCM10011369_36600 [Neiella marina]
MLHDKRMSSFLLLTSSLLLPTMSSANEVTAADTAKFKALGQSTFHQSSSKNYIVQLKDPAGITIAQLSGGLTPSNPSNAFANNSYNPKQAVVKSHTDKLEQLHQKIAQKAGLSKIHHSYTHTFNGFSAMLTESQAAALAADPDVVGVWEDELQKPTTANTPEFLGLNGGNGQHSLDIKGEGVIVGVVDTGIWPEHPSFADDGSYSDPALLGWNGNCDQGDDETFNCNYKLIGASYFNSSFVAAYPLIEEEFNSPRDADGHGSHTAGTAAGNESVTATLFGTDIGSVTGIAPRARVAAYKACWNSDFVTEDGEEQSGCFYGDTMAAIDQAVADGVDIINYSIGGSLTDLTTPAATSMLLAEQAGVFVSVSAGNSGPTAQTVGTPAPWVMSVAASTYSGESVTNAIRVTTSDEFSVDYQSVEGAITKPLVESGDITAALVVASPLEACFVAEDTPTALDNAEAIAGKIAVISRGSCAFVEKVARAQLAGAVAVVVYTNDDGSPIVMGGDDSFDIPGVMVSKADGELLASQIDAELAPIATLSVGNFVASTEVGNIMGDFSSRGPNLSTGDLIKPDITAPGVRILAATTAAPAFATQGESFAYLQGTSMSAPHIAGMAALLKEQNPTWTPSIIKSALMTSSYQTVVKEDGVTPADPFDFGAGHAAPVAAMTPGLAYEANFFDYMAFMCGLQQEDFVAGISGYSCQAYVNAEFDIDPSELNSASIAISELSETEDVLRTVTNVSTTDSVYTATIEAPAGVDVQLFTAQEDGSLVVAAGSRAQYALVFTPNDSAVLNQWVFGAITWTDSFGHSVRSPIAIKVVTPKLILAPESISDTVNAARDRLSFRIAMSYSGRTSTESLGMTAPYYATETIPQDEDGSFAFYEASLGKHFFQITDDVKVLRFSLSDQLVSVPGANLDLYVYRCIEWSCGFVGRSTGDTSDETVMVVDPEPADDISVGNVYLVMVHAKNIDGTAEAVVSYQMPSWFVDSANPSTTRVSASTRAIAGRDNRVSVTTKGLAAGHTYMGAVTFYDGDGVEQGTTVLELTAE